jgi:cobalt/nickel transport system permease protein
MQPIHLAIGIVEGVITGAVLCFVFKTRKEIITASFEQRALEKLPMKEILILFAAAAIFIGGFLSYFASSKPDGLEWAIQGIVNGKEIESSSSAHEKALALQEKTAILPDYSLAGEEKDNLFGTGISGLVGGIFTLTVTIVSGIIIIKYKKYKTKKAS